LELSDVVVVGGTDAALLTIGATLAIEVAAGVGLICSLCFRLDAGTLAACAWAACAFITGVFDLIFILATVAAGIVLVLLGFTGVTLVGELDVFDVDVVVVLVDDLTISLKDILNGPFGCCCCCAEFCTGFVGFASKIGLALFMIEAHD
jgi:hypothetical protein